MTKVSVIRSLAQEEASRGVPVRLRGVVTAFSGYKNSFFFDDGSGGISVDRTDSAEVKVGDEVEILGMSGPGLFAPVVLASEVRVLGRAPQPKARPATYADLVGGGLDSERIELQGVVRSAKMAKSFDRDMLLLRLDVGASNVLVYFQDFAGLDYKNLVDATIRIRGVSGTTFNSKRQSIGIYLDVPSRTDMDILQPAGPDPFSAKALPVRNALRFGQKPHRVKVQGVVTWQVPGHMLYLQDGADGIRIQTDANEVMPPGTRIEAVGFPAMGEYSPVLEEGIFRVLGRGTPVTPMRVEAKDVIDRKATFSDAKYDGQLVQIEGKIVETRIQGSEAIVILREGDEVFEARLTLSGEKPNREILPQNVVLVTGICTVLADADRNPASFVILQRSDADIAVLKKAPWWTPLHTVVVVSTVIGLGLLIALWVVILRHRVEYQTRVIRESEGRFRNLAQHDVLTGLPNRLMLEERIFACLDHCQQDNLRAAVFTIDIDRFKQINDTYGHLVGDECLKIVAARLRSAVRSTDTIARTGGEEFTLVAGSLASRDGAAVIASTLMNLFRDPMVAFGHELAVTVSAGCAVYPDDGLASDELRRRSDQALYEAKRTGRNRVVFASRELSAALERAVLIEEALREAMREESFALAYQPIYDGAGGVRRVEALLRATDERLAKLGPAAYMPVAEACGLVLPIGRWVLREACRQIAAWQAAGIAPCPVAVNISAAQLQQAGFADVVLRALGEFALDPRLLELELTETAVMTEISFVAEKMAQLAQAGVTFAIDDFGTGYSSLSRLHELPIGALKIDRSFIERLGVNRGPSTIIQAVIQMARSLRLQVVAEGIEKPAQMAHLREMGCDLFQGYLLAPPLSADAVALAMSASRAAVLTKSS
jgi:diguanylate cyclase (GGDEF)-like protein